MGRVSKRNGSWYKSFIWQKKAQTLSLGWVLHYVRNCNVFSFLVLHFLSSDEIRLMLSEGEVPHTHAQHALL